MAISFGSNFRSEFDKFKQAESTSEFLNAIIEFVQFMTRYLGEPTHPYCKEIKGWKVRLFNKDQHCLYPHQVAAIRECFDAVILSDELNSGYCFMPTSAGKGHILMTLAGLETISRNLPSSHQPWTRILQTYYPKNTQNSKLKAVPKIILLGKEEMKPILKWVKEKYGKDFVQLYENRAVPSL